MRLVSGSHDRTIKVRFVFISKCFLLNYLQVWSREDGSCTATLVGHMAAGVSCLALGEDKIISGGDDNDVKVWSFSEVNHTIFVSLPQFYSLASYCYISL